MTAERWNANLHAFDVLLRSVPPAAERGVDIGCGEGETARRLRARVPSVIGIDPDQPSIDEAHRYGDDIEYRCCALDDADLPPGSFDVVTSVAMLHHVDQQEGLAQMAALLRPGGLLLVVGLARSRSPIDVAHDARDAIGVRWQARGRHVWETTAPKLWPPPLTYAETRAASLEALPGARFARLPYFRYGLTWTAPRRQLG
ncbi:MAG: class I SAM-dependent methyltransferase [Acidimicrobiales bacterium]